MRWLMRDSIWMVMVLHLVMEIVMTMTQQFGLVKFVMMVTQRRVVMKSSLIALVWATFHWKAMSHGQLLLLIQQQVV